LIGQFGYTAYSGITLSGVAVPLLTEDLVPQLSEDSQPLARLMIEKRKGGVSKGIDGHEIKWEPVKGRRVHWSDHRRWLYAEPDYVWAIAVASAQEIYGRNEQHSGGIVIDQKLKDLALELIRLRPLVYAQLVFLSIQKSLMETINTNLLLQFAFGLFILSRLGVIWAPNNGSLSFRSTRSISSGKMVDVMLVLGLFFFFTKIFVVALVQTPQSRYYEGAEIFLTSILTVAAVAPWERIRSSVVQEVKKAE